MAEWKPDGPGPGRGSNPPNGTTPPKQGGMIRVQVPGSTVSTPSNPPNHIAGKWSQPPDTPPLNPSMQPRAPVPRTGNTIAGLPLPPPTPHQVEPPKRAVRVLGVPVIEVLPGEEHSVSEDDPTTIFNPSQLNLEPNLLEDAGPPPNPPQLNLEPNLLGGARPPAPPNSEVDRTQSSATSALLAEASPLERNLDTALRGDELAIVATERRLEPGPTRTVLGSVEILAHHDRLPQAKAVPLVSDPESPSAEDYRILLQRLRVGAAESRVIAVAAPTEAGISSEVAVNLALAMGEDASDPVLVVDANFGSPMVSSVLGVAPPECFASQMRGVHHLSSEDKRWVAMSVGFPHVHVLALDPNTAPATRRFDPPVFRAALGALAAAPYSLVLVDLPPPLRSSGFNLAGDLVDGVLLVAVKRTTRTRHLKQAAERLAPVPLLGTVLLR